ncbi:MAG: hypothetical protein ABFS86_04090 [Planctomycetota bacterium]
MERYRKYLGKTLSPERLADRAAIEATGFRGRWIPEVLEAFDEVELARPLDSERDLLLTLAVEEGAVARMLLGQAPAGDDDADARGLSEDELAAAVAEHGEAIEAVLELLTA